MDTIQRQVREFMIAAGQDCPSKLTDMDDETRLLRARLLLEETLETIDGLGISVSIPTSTYPREVSFDDLSFSISKDMEILATIDGMADVSFVNYGLANAMGIDMEPFEHEVFLNNMSKFIDGYKDENGKFRKGPSYKSVDLKPILDKQLGLFSTEQRESMLYPND